MEKDLSDSVVHNSSCVKESESDKSFVGKVKSIINNTPLSKWFWRHDDDKRSIVRRRDEVFEDEEICEMQPPLKKAKLPSKGNNCNNVLFNEVSNIPITNNIAKSKFNSFHEPVAGPSGIKSHKLLDSGTTISANSTRTTYSSNGLLNDLKDSDSEESTSGYSSVPRIGSKEQVCESQESSKQTSPLQNTPTNSRSLFHTSNISTSRSLFADRSLSPNMNTSMTSRRPSFNASTFGSPNFVDKTIATKKIINSPFYNGRTIYGGASAYGRSLGRSSQDLKTSSLRSTVQIKPVNKSTERDNLVLGKTAKRILDTLEQYSSPINDAKKIPVVSKPLRQDGLLTKYTGANPYIVRDTGPPNKELQIPSVSDLLKIKQRIRLQDSTQTVKKIAASSKSNLNTELYKISIDENEKEKHTGKVKTKVTAPVRQKQITKETSSEINLNPVALPITNLPKFDFNIPIPSPGKKISENVTLPVNKTETSIPSFHAQSPHKNVETEKNVQIQKETTTTTIIEYKFSDPLIIAENVKSLVPINNFKFSEPLCKKSQTDFSHNVTLNFKMPENKLPTLIPNKKKNNTETSQKTPILLTTGSVMDILGKKDNSLMEKFKPAQGTWECSVCMIRNQPEKAKCIACENPKSDVPKQTLQKDGFGSQYKMSADKWECDSCMVRNNNTDMTCVACATPKPSSNSTSNNTSSKTDGPVSGFGDKFKLSSNSWECPVCMIRNKNEQTKCAACEAPNPKMTTTLPSVNIDSKFRPPPNSWECSTCLVRNKEEVSKCVACETLKPGLKLDAAGFGNAFKVKDDEWECGVCMVRNKTSNTKCQCCESAKPGSASKPVLETANDKKPIATFNFGIDKVSATAFSFGIPSTASAVPSKEATNASSIFGENAKTTAPVSTTFSFGIPSTVQSKPASSESLTFTATTTTTPVLPTSNPLLKPNEKVSEKTEAVSSGFKFEVPTSAPINSQDKLISVEKSDTPTLVSSSSVNSNPSFNFKPVSANSDINKTVFGTKPESTSNTTTFNTPTVANTNIFSFVAKPSAAATPLTSTPATLSSQPIPAKPVFKFGSSNHLSSETPTPFAAVSTMNSTATTNGFVTTNTATFGTTNAPGFEAPMTNSSEVKPFTFNSASATGEPVSKAPAFSFGSASAAVTAAPTKAPGFNFGSTSTPTFNFTGGKTETNFNTPVTNNMFGTAASTTGKNGTFNFGSMASNNNNQKAGFSFGAAVNNTSVAPAAQSGFSFGAAAPAQSSGGFNFAGAPPTFNVAAKPSFNFTDGNVAAFTAQPTTDGGLPAPRKIKRAVRRTQR